MSITAFKEELVRSQKSSDTDDTFDLMVMEPMGMVMARLFIRVGFTPNMVTVLSMIFGIFGGFLFSRNDYGLNVLGILVEIFAAVLDCSDGQVARLTDSRSRIGRILDGISDAVCFAAMYLGLGWHLMKEVIPFTDGIVWGFWIWPVVIVCGLGFHQTQCRMADYYRNVHLFFQKGITGSDLSRSGEILQELSDPSGKFTVCERFFLRFYLNYTRKQEAKTPKLQQLLKLVDRNGKRVSKELSDAYVSASRQVIHLTSLLTYNLRAFSLYLLILLRIPVFYFPFVILVMGCMERIMIRKYEGIAEDLLRNLSV